MSSITPHNPLEGERPELNVKLNEGTDEHVSIIIVHKDRPEYLNICLQSIAVTSFNNNYEIIVVDNNSGKDSQDFLNDIENEVKVIRNETNLYWSAACNKGVQAAREAWLSGPLFTYSMQNSFVAARLKAMLNRFEGGQWTQADPSYQTAIPSIKRLEQIKCPVAVMVGAFDIAEFKGCAMALKNKVHQALYKEIPNAGHCSNMDNPAFVNLAIAESLAPLRDPAFQLL
jgi:pimeloyl-ACP methyl ester carboxylesterase